MQWLTGKEVFSPAESGGSSDSEDRSGGSPGQPNVEGGSGEDESDAGGKTAGGKEQELGEEPQNMAPPTEGGGSAQPLKRSRRRTAFSVHEVDLKELSAKLGIPLEDDASDSEFEPSVEDLGEWVGVCVCVCACACVCEHFYC